MKKMKCYNEPNVMVVVIETDAEPDFNPDPTFVNYHDLECILFGLEVRTHSVQNAPSK